MFLSSLVCLFSISSGLGTAQSETRPFRMGFTYWPSDLTPEGVQLSNDFVNKHSDIVSIMYIGGIPWQEALTGGRYSKDVEDKLSFKAPPGKKLFVSISLLNESRSGLAAYWGERDNMPLPPDWAARAMNSPEVKQAYKKFALDVIDKMHPDMLAIGVELNSIMTLNPPKGPEAAELYRETYKAVKLKHPKLDVFFTTEIMHYSGLSGGSDKVKQAKEVEELMRYSDLFAMSFYPHMSASMPRPVPMDFLAFATKFKKPIAVAECGMTSQNVELKSLKLTLPGSDKEQSTFLESVLGQAQKDKYRFVVQFAGTDFEKLCDRLPPEVGEIARIWQYTGLQTSSGKPKPALRIWAEAFDRKLASGD